MATYAFWRFMVSVIFATVLLSAWNREVSSQPAATTGMNVLSIQPIPQTKSEYCWLANGEMIFRHYNIPQVPAAATYQCGILLAAGRQCFNVGSGPATAIAAMITLYPQFVRQYYVSQAIQQLHGTWKTGYLTNIQIKPLIDNDTPIVAGITPFQPVPPAGLSEHAVLIVGYDIEPNVSYVYVNDPFPYWYPQFPDQPPPPGAVINPYALIGATQTQPGQYKVEITTFITRMVWSNSIMVTKV